MADSPQDKLAHKALAHWERGERERAMELLAEQERVCRDLGDLGSVAVSLTDQGLIMRDGGDESGAQGKLQEALEIAREAGLPSLVERIELRLRRDVGAGDPLRASLNRDRTLGAEERLDAVFREGRVRARSIRDEQETGLDETRRGY